MCHILHVITTCLLRNERVKIELSHVILNTKIVIFFQGDAVCHGRSIAPT